MSVRFASAMMGDVSNRFLCFARGFPGLSDPPWDNDAPSDEICPSCGIHFGYDDDAGGDPARREAVYREWRQRWGRPRNEVVVQPRPAGAMGFILTAQVRD